MESVSFENNMALAKAEIEKLSCLAPCLIARRQARVEQALHRAAATAVTQAQSSTAQQAMCSAYLIFSDKAVDVKTQQFYFEQAVLSLVRAEQWHTSASLSAKQYEACLRQALQILANPAADLDCGLALWARLIRNIPRGVSMLRCRISMDQAQWTLDQGLLCMAAAPDFKVGLKCGYEATGPVELAVQCAQACGNSKLVKESEQLKDKIYTFIRCTCESVQARVQANQMLAGFGAHPHEEQVWQAVDKYTQAVRQTEEADLLNECRAHACLGMIFDKHLKLRDKAVLNCKRAVELGHTIRPRPIGEDWFQESEAILRKIQRQQAAEAQAQQDQDHQRILQNLKPQLQAIEAAKKRSARDLLVHLKAKHPPKFKSALAEPEYDDIKRALRKASVEYHPDKQTPFDKTWQVLAAEISKSINEVWAGYCS